MRQRIRIFVFAILALLLSRCSDSPAALDMKTVYSGAVSTILYEVDYMPGMEPYTGTANDGEIVWNFLKSNISALFNGKKTITIPTTLSEMRQIDAGSGNYSQEKIAQLAENNRQNLSLNGSTASIYIVYLDGYFEVDGAEDKTVLGISIGTTGVIALFKKAIQDNTFPSLRLRSFVEQSVLIHESGHSLGLVNNGLAMTTTHQDAAHGAHCTNKACVMYYLNEGVKDLLEFLSTGNPSTQTVIFGDECLADAHAALPAE